MKRKNVLIAVLVMLGSFLFSPVLEANVSNVRVKVKQAHYKGKCPKKFEFIGEIKSTKSGIVRYQWIRSDNATAPVRTVRFKKPGVKRVMSTWTIGRNYKGWKAIRILSPNKMVSNRAPFSLICSNKLMTVKPLKPVRGLKPLDVSRACPDPAASSIEFSIVSRDPASRFKGRVRITGIVKNVGTKAFRSNPNQASAHLYEVSAGGGRAVLKAQQNFDNLAPGAAIRVVFERNWNSSSPSEGEFPPSYRLLIVYDPDITLDGNKDNDDCNGANNRKERSGTGINSLLR